MQFLNIKLSDSKYYFFSQPNTLQFYQQSVNIKVPLKGFSNLTFQIFHIFFIQEVQNNMYSLLSCIIFQCFISDEVHKEFISGKFFDGMLHWSDENPPDHSCTRICTEEARDCPSQRRSGSWWNPPRWRCLDLRVSLCVALSRRKNVSIVALEL